MKAASLVPEVQEISKQPWSIIMRENQMNQIEKISTFLAGQKEKMVELEKLLTSIPALAPENGGDGEEKKADALEKWLKDQGFTHIQRFEAPDSRVSSGKRPSLVVTISGQSDSAVWSMAHLDVVPVGDKELWNTNPWEAVEKDGKIYGRGVEDNQQGLVSSVFAALYLLKNQIKPSRTVKLLFMADEEVGSKYGIIWLLNNTSLFKKDDLILIPDGGDPKGETIEVAEKNILWLKFHVLGKQAHGSRPDQGNNACLAASDLSLRIHALEKVFSERNKLFEPDYTTIQPTMRFSNVEGVNIIPGKDTFCVDARILPCYSINQILAAVEEKCSEIEDEYKVQVCYEVLQSSESPATAVDAPVVEKLKEALKSVHGIKARTIGIGGGTVGAELRRLGYSCAVWSTLDECAHMPNEYCLIENMIKDAETLAYFFS